LKRRVVLPVRGLGIIKMKRQIFLIFIFFTATSLFAQMDFNDIIWVWNPIESLGYIISEDIYPRIFTSNSKDYSGW